MNKFIDDEEPVIIADYKFDATRIGDYIGSFIEHWCFDVSAHYIRNFSIQYMKEFMPMPARDGYLYGQKVKLNTESIVGMGVLPLIPEPVKSHIKSDGNAYFDKKDSYRFNVIPIFSLANEKNKKAWQKWSDEVFFDSPQKCTDDTKFAEDMARTYVKHDDVYQLSNDAKDYKFVSPDSNFANTSSTKNNFEHDYMDELASNYNSDSYAKREYGGSAGEQISAMSKYANQKDVNFSRKITEYKKNSRAKGEFGGVSYGNGSVMRMGPNIFVAQGFKQGLKLTEISVRNTHDHEYSIKSAKAVETVGLCANDGLRRETMLKIIHFLYYDPSPLKTTDDKERIGSGRNCFLKRGKLDFCNFDMLSHREGKVSKNTTPQDLQLIDEEDAKNYIENNEFTEKCLPTAMLAIKICLTSKCAEEAMSKILRAAGDCDTIAATALPMIAALFGLPKKWVDRIYEISMCKDKTAAMNKMTDRPQTKENTKDENYQDNPKDIKVFDKDGYFIEHNEISRMANEKFKHHYREYAPIEWQLKNICELMEYLKDQEKNSKAQNRNQLLKEIFNDIKSDINFMLDKEQKYELEELSQDVKNTLENMQEITKEEIKKDDKKLIQKLKQEDAKYKAEINKHRNATAKFQTKMKNQKLDNLTKENIVHIGEEIKPINSILKKYKLDEVSVSHLKAKEQVIKETIENNDSVQIHKKLNKIDCIDQNSNFESLKNVNQNQMGENDNKTNGINKAKQNLIIGQIETGSVQEQVKKNDNKSQNELPKKQEKKPQINKSNDQNNNKTNENEIDDNRYNSASSEKKTTEQNKMNHKPFIFGGSTLLITDIFLFVFAPKLVAYIVAVVLILLLFIWVYEAFSSPSKQSVDNSVGINSEDKKQPLITEDLTKKAEIGNLGPSQENSNTQKAK